MQQAPTRVLKKDRVVLVGRRAVGDGTSPAPTHQPVPGTARIVQQDDGGAIVEVICRCGETIRLRCSYA